MPKFLDSIFQLRNEIHPKPVPSLSMWATVLVLALISATEPMRFGITALLVALPRPMTNLFAYWLGLMSSAFGVALVALFVLRDLMLPVVNTVTAAFDHPVVPPIQVAVGVLALSAAAAMAMRSSVGMPAAVAVAGGSTTLVLEPPKPNLFARLGVNSMLERGSVRISYLVGFFSSIPPVEFWGAMTAILAAQAAAGTQVSAALLFLFIGFAIAELPLVGYLISPVKTRAAVEGMHNLLRANRKPVMLICLSLFGALMIGGGAGLV